LKILVACPNLFLGGTQRVVVNLVNEWVGTDHKVTLITDIRGAAFIDELDPRVVVKPIQLQRLRYWYKLFKNEIHGDFYDIIVVNQWPLTTICWLGWLLSRSKSKFFVCEHTTLSLHIQNDMPTPIWIARIAILFSHRFSSGCIAVSKGAADDLTKFGILKRGAVKVIYNPIGVSDLKNHLSCSTKSTVFQKWSSGLELKLLAVGALIHSKGFDVLIEAMLLLRERFPVKLAILGDGPLRNDLELKIQRLGLSDSVLLPGFVLDPGRWYSKATLSVVSSRLEGFSNVIVESLYVGTPVVSTNCKSGPSEILCGGVYGVLVEAGCSQALSDGIVQALSTEWDKEKLMGRARAYAPSKIAAEYIRYFNSTLS
jgi:glycosyltransferase involved in cell wall biosynthesis